MDQCFLLQTDKRKSKERILFRDPMTDGETLDVEQSPTFYITDAPLLQKETEENRFLVGRRALIMFANECLFFTRLRIANVTRP